MELDAEEGKVLVLNCLHSSFLIFGHLDEMVRQILVKDHDLLVALAHGKAIGKIPKKGAPSPQKNVLMAVVLPLVLSNGAPEGLR